ncbi:MAG TPA: hypothetical protein VFQ71_08945 [Gaiellales bacterium]|nr:hypothetical protein [Gaiellales bacterium]
MFRAAAILITVVVCAFAGSAASAHAATHTWAAYEIGPMEPNCPPEDCDDDITGWDINAKGWVAGDAFPDFHWPWTWREAANPTLVSPGHTLEPGFSNTGFTAINSAGDTAGYTNNIDEGGSDTHAILFKGGVLTDLGTLQGATGSAEAFGINDLDTVVGDSRTVSGFFHAFRWTSGTGMVDLGTLGGDASFAFEVNGSNQIVGGADLASGNERAFLFQNGSMHNLGTLGGAQSEAESINAGGEIVGWADTKAGKQDAFIRTGSKLVDIGKLLNATSSVALDVDNNGDVVGTATRPSGQFSWLYIGGHMVNVTQRTVTCCDANVAGALNKTLQLAPRGDLSSETVPVLEPVTPFDELSGRLTYSGIWTRTAHAGSWGGHVKSSTHAGASVRLRFTGRRIWWIAPEGTTEGSARVFIDGHLVTTVDLHLGFDVPRTTAWVHAFSAVGTHTVKIVVVGTAGHPKVSVDAFAVSQR